ncbi:Mitochondrial distribution and morphology protein 38 [Diplonema papillatum]|nr:Mitochondrial distribution and morphology protein 38 [Diplonema papillatum]
MHALRCRAAVRAVRACGSDARQGNAARVSRATDLAGRGAPQPAVDAEKLQRAKPEPAADDTVSFADVLEIMGKTKAELFDEIERKVTRWDEIKQAVRDWWKETKEHYVHGTRLLIRNVKTSTSIARKSLHGYPITRRERRMLSRTLGDVFRVVPFSIFVIVPFMELLLPVALKVFPNMLPSTYDDPKRAERTYQTRLSAQVELTRFLQDTLEEMAVQVQKQSESKEMRDRAAKLYDFILSLRDKEGTQRSLTYEQLKQLLPLFKEDLGLSKMRRPQLIAMCKLLETPHLPFGSEESMRIGLRMHLRKLKTDDMMIAAEGIEALSDKEVTQACKMRAIKVPKGAHVEDLKKELSNWLILSRQPGVSHSLMLLSRVMPMGDIRKLAEGAARDLQMQEEERIEQQAEQQWEFEETKELMTKSACAEYEKFMTERHPGKTFVLPPGEHAFMMTPAQLEGKRVALKSLKEDVETLEDAAEGIMELKEDALGFREEFKHPTTTMGLLEKKIARNILGLESKLRLEQAEIVLSSAANLRTFPKEFEDKFDTIHEAAALKSLPLDQQQPQDEYDSKTADTQTASTVPCPRGVRDVVDTDEEPAAEQPANPSATPATSSPPANSKVESLRSETNAV